MQCSWEILWWKMSCVFSLSLQFPERQVCWICWQVPLTSVCSFVFSRLPTWTQTELAHTVVVFMVHISRSVKPNLHWLAASRQVVHNTRQTMEIQSWTLELITNIEWERWLCRYSCASLNICCFLLIFSGFTDQPWAWISKPQGDNK